MGLPSDLISQLVKATNDNKSTKGETTVYGTIVEYEGSSYVKLDGSELLTPITTTTVVKPGERVTVMIKNHSAVVTGNVTSPAAQGKDVDEAVTKANDAISKVSEFDIIVSYRVTTDELNAINATIDKLKATVANFGDVTALNADIEKLRAEYAELEYVKADDVKALTATIENIQAKFGDFSNISAEDLDAANAEIDNLKAYNADFTYVSADMLKAIKAEINSLSVGKLDALYAKITDLNATNANVTNLKADVADIDTLIFGSASGDTIQTSFANAVIAQLANAQIKSAMIDSVSADKITAGDIITNNVRVMSEDGRLLISDETLQISDSTRVRVQIGKDAANDYSINVWDADGNLMFSKGGITDSAIKEAIIRNDMVSPNANIHASKLDIDSLFTVINEDGSNTLKSSKVLIDADNQTLDVAFKSMTTKVETAQEAANKNASDMAKIVSDLNADIENLQSQIDGSITSWFYEVEPTNDNEPAVNWTTVDLKNEHLGDLYYDTITGYCYRWQVQNGVYSWQNISDTDVTKALSLAQSAKDTADQKRRVFYVQPTPPYDVGDLWVQGSDGDILRCQTAKVSGLTYAVSDWVLASKYTDDTVANKNAEDIKNLSTTVSSQGTDISVIKGQISTKVWQQDIDTAKNEMSSQYSTLEQNLNKFETTVGETYATKEELSDVEVGGRNLFENSGKLVPDYFGNYSCPDREYSFGEDPSVPSGQYIAMAFSSDESVTYAGGPYLASYKTGYIPKMIAGEEYTVSIWVKCSTAKTTGKCAVEFLKDVTHKVVPALSTEWQRYVVTGTYNGNLTSSTAITFYYASEWLDGDVFYVSSPKIEKGRVVTDWTPAPEDIDTRVSTNESSITQMKESITTNVAAIDDLGSRVTEVKQTADGLTISVKTAQETADGIKVGGRNLAVNTGLTNGAENTAWYQSTATAHTDEIIDDNFTVSRKARVLTYTEAGCYGPYWTTTNSSLVGKNFVVGDVYTQSVLMKATEAITIIWGHEGLTRHQATLTNEWQRFTFTVAATDTKTMDRGISFYPYPFAEGAPAGTVLYIADYKLESGNRATDWTPAPEDMATSNDTERAQNTADNAQTTANNAETLVQQLTDSISMLVTDGNGTSLMTQTESGWTFSTADIQTAVNKASEDLGTLTNELGDTNHTVDVLQQAVADLGEIAEYVKIGTYENEPCIELGEGDSDFKLFITNTRIMFMEGSSVVAHITNQSLHIKKAVIEEELQQGEFVWKVRSNGNMGLVWKGVSS